MNRVTGATFWVAKYAMARLRLITIMRISIVLHLNEAV
jgi:hypothetical protein